MSIFTIPGINVTSASARRIFSKRMGSGQLHVQLYATSLPPFRRQHFRHSLDVSVYSIQMDWEWCLREASRYNFSLLWPWSLTSCTPTSTIHALASGRGDLCGFALKSVNLFWKYSIHKLARVERTKRRMDRSRTLYVWTGVRINSVYSHCCYCIRVFLWCEHVLSALARFLVHLLGVGEG